MQKIIATVKYYTDKRYSTIAGTLVYFLLMSVAPFIFWLTLVFGKVDVENVLSMRIFESVSPVLHDLKNSAESATGGAGILFLLTSLYSSTNFFYHLRRSGEMIYESPKVKGGLKLRITSLVLIFAAILLVALIGGISVVGSAITEFFLPPLLASVFSTCFLAVLAFAVALVLNVFACPYKMKLYEALPGSLLTTGLWLVLGAGFAVYTRFANPERLYGKIASLIVFLLWCYVMISSFVIGMINNGKSFTEKPVLKRY